MGSDPFLWLRVGAGESPSFDSSILGFLIYTKSLTVTMVGLYCSYSSRELMYSSMAVSLGSATALVLRRFLRFSEVC